MKKTSQILIAMVLLLISNAFYGQTHTITLTVDTDNLNRRNVTSESITSFSAEDTQVDVASPPEDFEITVPNGATIIWEGVSSSSDEDTVEIIMIKWEKGPRIFSLDDIPGNGNGTAQAIVNGQTPDEPYKYKILFKVNGAGRIYQIDPKIKIGPGN